MIALYIAPHKSLFFFSQVYSEVLSLHGNALHVWSYLFFDALCDPWRCKTCIGEYTYLTVWLMFPIAVWHGRCHNTWMITCFCFCGDWMLGGITSMLICSFMDIVYRDLYAALISTHPVYQRWSNCISLLQPEYALWVECTSRNDAGRR